MALSAKQNYKLNDSFTREFIEAQQQSLSKPSRFPFMRFEPKLEVAFEQFRYHRLIKRVPIIGLTGLVLFALFSILDFYSLPEAVFSISIPIRLFLICPSIILIIFLAKKTVSADLFMWVYFAIYLIAGASIIVIIYTAGVNDHPLPYDGILLQLVFGYFLMGLPYMLAIYGGVLVSAGYIFISIYMNLPLEQLASNIIFILCLNFIGAIGCYIQERARRFLFLNERLVALAKEKDKKEIASKTRLVATASHDLRQPLHAMNLLIEALDDLLPNGKQKEIVKSLDLSIKQLSQLLSTLLDISKLNAGIVEPKIENLNLAEKMLSFCQEQTLRSKEAGIQLSCDGKNPLFVRVDPLLLDRIIRNIMENIFIHAQANNVKFAWISEQGSACLTIKDDGKGIPKEDLKTIFEEFQQSADSVRAGMGLGLTIVKQLAELQGMSYHLSSEPNAGSCFSLRMPLASSQYFSCVKPQGKVAIIKKQGSGFVDAWIQQISQWAYEVVTVPLGDHMTSEHISKMLPEGAQVLIWDALDQKHFDSFLDQVREIQSFYPVTLPVLIISNADSSEIPSLEESLFEIVSPSVRPAKLRVILEHLMKRA